MEFIAANDPAGGSRFRAVSLSSAELTRLTRSLASLIEAGLTVEQAFNALIEQAETERERQVLAALRGEVMAGSTITKALGTFPGVFAELYRTLIAAGETAEMALPDRALKTRTKCWTRSGMSSGRSRSGGSSIGNTFSR